MLSSLYVLQDAWGKRVLLHVQISYFLCKNCELLALLIYEAEKTTSLRMASSWIKTQTMALMNTCLGHYCCTKLTVPKKNCLICVENLELDFWSVFSILSDSCQVSNLSTLFLVFRKVTVHITVYVCVTQATLLLHSALNTETVQWSEIAGTLDGPCYRFQLQA
jgi:hypothetical protein